MQEISAQLPRYTELAAFLKKRADAEQAAQEARAAYTIGPDRTEKPELIKEIID
jgi:hypothetical protein